MIDFMLDDLRRKARELLPLFGKGHIAVFDLDGLIALRLALARKGQAAFLRLIGFGRMLDDFGIEQRKISRPRIHGDDAFGYADHIGRQPHAVLAMRRQGVEQILRHRDILFDGLGRFLLQEKFIVYDFFYHIYLPSMRAPYAGASSGPAASGRRPRR